MTLEDLFQHKSILVEAIIILYDLKDIQIWE
jgi:hypothetical protein